MKTSITFFLSGTSTSLRRDHVTILNASVEHWWVKFECKNGDVIESFGIPFQIFNEKEVAN